MSSSGKPSWKSPWQWGGYVLPTLIALCLLFSPIGRLVELFSFDLLYLFRPSPDPTTLTEVVILNMDEESRSKLDQDANRPWDRGLHARLVRELKARGAKVVVFDILFKEPSPDPRADSELAAAIREHGRVVLGASLLTSRNEGRPPTVRLLPPVNALGANVPWGVVEIPTDQGSAPMVRRQFNDKDYTNLAWQAAVAFDKAPAHRLSTRWLNFYGPGGTLPAVSYHRAMETNSLPPDYFRGKGVFVGGSGIITSHGQSREEYSTPFSRWRGGQTSGVELHATAFLNLVRADWLEELPPLAELLLLILAGGISGFGLARVRPWTAAGLALAGAVLIGGGSFALAWGLHRWFPWLIVIGAQIPLALVGSLLAHASAKEAASPDGATTLVPAEKQRVPSISDHRMLRCVGRGAYGEVWLARDVIGTFHAVKLIYRSSFNSEVPFEREFKGMQKYTPISRNHPGWVHVLHVGRNDAEGYFYYVMEAADDETSGQEIDPDTYQPRTLARELQKRGRLPIEECLELGIALAEALDYLHGQLLVHRDIKPSNVIFVHGVPKFTDVGLVTEVRNRDHSVSFLGTEGYIAPEGPGTAAADIYSLGKLLYEVSTGRDRMAFPAPASTLDEADGADGLQRLTDIIRKVCAEQAGQRYHSAAELREELVRLQRSRTNSPGPA